jgi:hypothetical protein
VRNAWLKGYELKLQAVIKHRGHGGREGMKIGDKGQAERQDKAYTVAAQFH